jgi:hypothetical protein
MEAQDRFVKEKGDRLDRHIHLDCSAQTLRNYRHLGKGPAYSKRGRMVRYLVADLLDFMTAGRVDPESR